MRRNQEVSIDKIVPILQVIGDNIGVPCSLSLTRKLKEDVTREWFETDAKIKRITGFEGDIDYASRTGRLNHFAVIAGDFLYNDKKKFCGKMNNSGYYSVSLPKDKLEKMSKYLKGEQRVFVELLMRMATTDKLLSRVRTHLDLVEYMSQTRTDNDDKDIVWIPTNYSVGKTGRIINDNISVQNMPPRLRETIKAPKGYKLVSCDIKAQEVVICINAVFRDNELKRLYMQERDCYRALLRRLGFEISKETRNLAKIPILGKIRGMSDRTVYADMGEDNREMAEAMLSYINNDPGMVSIIEMAREEANSATPRLRGLFKSVYPLVLTDKELTGSKNEVRERKVRKILSAVFQTTAAELLSYSLGRIFLQQIEGSIPKGKDFMFISAIHDEVVFLTREDLVEEAKEIVEREFLVEVKGWCKFAGETSVGDHYESK